MARIRIGTAGWALPQGVRDRFPEGASNLGRYAARFDATEINSSFHRPHRRATYERWAASVPADFRFAVKLPKTVTHQAKLAECDGLLARFAEETGGLGDKRGPILVQLPPSFAFDAALADGFFKQLAAIVGAQVVFEPRHASWFEPAADALLATHRVARVAADPAPVPAAATPGGWRGLSYLRLHGSPRVYWSSYDEERLADYARRAEGASETWVIFDNTGSGAATGDALAFQALTGCMAETP